MLALSPRSMRLFCLNVRKKVFRPRRRCFYPPPKRLICRLSAGRRALAFAFLFYVRVIGVRHFLLPCECAIHSHEFLKKTKYTVRQVGSPRTLRSRPPLPVAAGPITRTRGNASVSRLTRPASTPPNRRVGSRTSNLGSRYARIHVRAREGAPPLTARQSMP